MPDPTGLGPRRARQGRPGRRASSSTPDATAEELEIDEINTSIYCFRRNLLAPALRRLSPENAQGEYYLTDAVGVLRAAGHKVIAMTAEDPGEAIMVNDRAQLADAEAELRGPHQPPVDARRRHDGRPAARTYVDATVEIEPDVRILPGTILEGRTSIGAGSVIGPDCRLVDAIVGERVTRGERGGARRRDRRRLHVGPFAYLRPGTRLAAGREGRHVRRGEELRDRRGHEGAAPLLRRRRRHRR